MCSMHLNKIIAKFVFTGLLLAFLGMMGCAHTPRMGRYSVEIQLDESLADANGVLPSV